MSRETFLARVRNAARAGRAYRVHLRETPPGAGYVGGGDDLCARMAREVNEVGGTAHLVHSLSEAAGVLLGLLDAHQVRSAVCWRHELLDRLGLAELLQSRKIVPLTHEALAPLDPAERRQRLLAAEIGITSVDCAVAETGTLLVGARPGQERLASLLPPVHVALVEETQILPDLFDAFEDLQAKLPDGLPSNISLITGPSKTGDIELQLTTGVHGPGQWHVIVIRQGA